MKSLNQSACCIQRGAVVLPDKVVEGGTVIFKNGKIAHAGAPRRTPRGAEEVDALGRYVCPGLFDVHFHGAGQHSLDPPDADSFRYIADFLQSRGVLRFIPAMMPCEDVIVGLARLIDETGLRDRIPGVYPEGPFVNPAKRGGIQAKYLEPVDLRRLKQLQERAGGKIVMMTFAPELEGSAALPDAMRQLRILPCVGHTLASAARIAEVLGRRKVNFTHLFNAMSGADHHEPGAALYGLNHDNAYVEVNPDGTHVAPEMLRLIQRAKRPDRIVLISDAVVSAGERPGRFAYMGRDIVADARGVYYAREGTLVGSRILLNEGVARFMKFTGAPVHEAVRMASLNPAALLGLARRTGSLETGKSADIVIFSRSFRVAHQTFFQGARVK